jgi:hypothetical protein
MIHHLNSFGHVEWHRKVIREELEEPDEITLTAMIGFYLFPVFLERWGDPTGRAHRFNPDGRQEVKQAGRQ